MHLCIADFVRTKEVLFFVPYKCKRQRVRLLGAPMGALMQAETATNVLLPIIACYGFEVKNKWLGCAMLGVI